MRKDEEALQIQLANWMTLQHPWAMFRSDGGGIRLPIGLAVKFKRLNGGRRAWPDFFIAEPVGKFNGLFVEIKKEKNEIYTKNGDLRRSSHIQEQAAMLSALRERGYAAEFGCGFEGCVSIINRYLGAK